MISKEELRRLAEFESPHGCAVSFYFQPGTPSDGSHRQEAILAKDLVRDALRQAERDGRAAAVRPDLERILNMAEQLHGNHARAKAIFACRERDLWREFDLKTGLPGTQLVLNHRFHLQPLARARAQSSRCSIALVDRETARIFEYDDGELEEKEDLINELSRRGRSDGFGGYNGGHAERHVENEAKRHFKIVAERLQERHGRGEFDWLLIGCHEQAWPEIQAHLHTYLKQRLLGHFAVEPRLASRELLRQHAERALEEHRASEQQALVREALGEARRKGRGAAGLGNVLLALERGEAQTIVIAENFSPAAATECAHCGHLDARLVQSCALCGQPTRELHDVSDALVSQALRRGVALAYAPADPDFERAGNIAALLRFRSDQNTSQKLVG